MTWKRLRPTSRVKAPALIGSVWRGEVEQMIVCLNQFAVDEILGCSMRQYYNRYIELPEVK